MYSSLPSLAMYTQPETLAPVMVSEAWSQYLTQAMYTGVWIMHLGLVTESGIISIKGFVKLVSGYALWAIFDINLEKQLSHFVRCLKSQNIF